MTRAEDVLIESQARFARTAKRMADGTLGGRSASASPAAAPFQSHDHPHSHVDPRELAIPQVRVYRSTNYGPLAQAGEFTVPWEAVAWDNGDDEWGFNHWNPSFSNLLTARKLGIHTIYGGTFWTTNQSLNDVWGQITAHVKVDGVTITDPHHSFQTEGPLVGPALTFSVDYRLPVGANVEVTVLQQHTPAGPDPSLLGGSGFTYFGMTWRGP